MPFLAGENVGPYRILAQLGQGGMATVFKAYHAALDRHVAIKVLHPAFKEDPQFLQRFHREAKVVAKLEHPNIIPIYDFSEHKGQPYLVLKYIEGETLKARLARGTLAVQEAVDVIQAVGTALNYAHKQGVLHRDVKPSNILLSEDGRIYLADFGLARMAELGASTLSGDMLIGTPFYISPEQGSGNSELDERTDIYSFGIVLYEMIVGKVPFTADTPFSIIHDHIYTPLPLPSAVNPSVPEEVEIVLLKALSKNPQDRFSSGREMAEAFIESLQSMDQSNLTKALGALPAIGINTQQQAEGVQVSAMEAEIEPVQETTRNTPITGWVWIALGLTISCMAIAAILTTGSKAQESDVLPTENASSIITLPSAIPESSTTDFGSGEENIIVDEDFEDTGFEYLQRAQSFAESGNDQAAAKQYLLAGEKFLQEGMPFEASKALVQGITLLGGPDTPASKPRFGLLAAALYFSVPHEEFEPFIEELKTSGARWPFLRLLDARSFILDGEYARAERIIQDALDREPGTLLASLLLAELKIAQGNSSEALSIIEETLERPRIDGWMVDVLNDLKHTIEQAS
ncbi:MAG: serine/threonine protein kinase [Chloroflexi bacterium]|nr:serine/threonine protein kinase [Chloroflexota bacterium]